MLTFLRRIRRSLLSDNKFSKYLLYAIGEILLVVIGILLALQVNNWNEERKNKKIEKEILKDLRVEFTANLQDALRNAEEHKRVYNELESIQKLIRTKDYDHPHLDSLLHACVKWFSFTPRPGASNNLINSGNLNIISNTELRDLLTRWPGVADDVQDDEERTIDFTVTSLAPYFAELYPTSNIDEENLKLIKPGALYDKEKDFVPVINYIDYTREELLENKKFQGLIGIRKIYEVHCFLEVNSAAANCNSILALIDTELQDD